MSGAHTTTSDFILIETITDVTATGISSYCIMAVLITFVTVFTAFINVWKKNNVSVACSIYSSYYYTSTSAYQCNCIHPKSVCSLFYKHSNMIQQC